MKLKAPDNLLQSLTTLFQKKNALFIIGITGIMLIFLSDILFAPKKETQEQPQATTLSSQVQAQSYVQDLEKRLTEMIISIEGAGEATVMITLDSVGETVYAQDEKTQTQAEMNADGSTNQENLFENQHTIIDAKDGKQPLVEAQLLPEIKGVAVLCQGADDISVVARITDLVSVVLGLSTNRICVTKMI